MTRNVILTGATSGIGMAFARIALRNGHNVVLNGRSREKMDTLLEETKSYPGKSVPVLGDCTEPTIIEGLVGACVDTFKAAPDLCVVNAGRGLPGTITSSDESQWDELFDVNVVAVLRQLRSFTACLVNDAAVGELFSKPRDIVVTGSSIGRNVSPFNPVYGATKFAVHSAAEALRRDIGTKGIRVSLIEPGIVKTGFQETAGYDQAWFEQYAQEIGPVLSADDIARTIDFITSQPAHVHINNVMIRPTRQAYP